MAQKISTKPHMKTSDWYFDELFWLTVRPAMFPNEILSSAHGDAATLVNLLGLKRGARLVDLCCGFGRFALQFAQMGYQVTGVDSCEPFLDELKSTASAKALSVDARLLRIQELDYEGKFDAAFLLYTSFAYSREQKEDVEILRRILRSLRPRGQFLLDLYSVSNIRRNLLQVQEAGQVLSVKHRAISQDNLQWGWLWIDAVWQVATPSNVQSFTIGQRFYTESGLRHILCEAGFTNIKIFGTYSGAPYSADSDKIVALAERP